MRRWITLLAALVLTIAAFAREQKVRDVTINVTLFPSGSALVQERWDVNTGDEITEWYLPRTNLGDIAITDFSVASDGNALSDDVVWDVNRTREQKAGRYGIVRKDDGLELCWGVGEYGDHVYEPVYVMTNAVKTLKDYDMLHLQLVSDELASPPLHVRVSIRLADDMQAQLDTSCCRIWGFGFRGTSVLENGAAVFESTEPFTKESSVIALMRFDKGLFASPSIQDKEFQAVLDEAMEGADFGVKKDKPEGGKKKGRGISTILALLLLFLIGRRIVRSGKPSKREQNQLAGTELDKIGWYHDIPMEGDLPAADYALDRLKEKRPKNALASAEILRMIYNGYIDVQKDAEGKVELRFAGNTEGKKAIDSLGSDLLQMMRDASGEDQVLQDKEFSNWFKENTGTVDGWKDKVLQAGKRSFLTKLWMEPSAKGFTAAGQKETQNLIGLKKYLQDFTLSKQRDTSEAHLWQDYLVYAAMFGIADKVAEQLKDIDPSLFERAVGYDYTTFSGVLDSTETLSRAITGTTASSSGSSGAGGFGGTTSFGGGGGFSGGGHGGGGR